jgi:hypothetical protein
LVGCSGQGDVPMVPFESKEVRIAGVDLVVEATLNN